MQSLLLTLTLTACGPFSDAPLVGQDGNPRFNLYYIDEIRADLDLHVTDPAGEHVSWQNTTAASGGELDVDCTCGSCPQGPSENIYWPEDGSAPEGEYTFWIEHYDDCTEQSIADFYVRVLIGEEVVEEYIGEMSASDEPEIWTYTHQY